MIPPRLFWVGRYFRQIFAVMALAALLWICAGENPRETAASAGCTAPDGRCAFLPLIYRTPDPRIRADAMWMYHNLYQVGTTPAMGWTGDVDGCNAGNINQGYRDVVLRRVNYFRLMAGVPAITGFLDAYNQQAQAAAALVSENGLIVHDVPPNWKCYKTLGSLGSEGARYSNMVGNYNGWNAVDYYMRDDGDTVVALRRYILYPQTQDMGDGDVPVTTGHMSVNALRVIDDHYYNPRPDTRDAFVSWPPAAYVPYQVVYALWSFSFEDADFSQAWVSMTKGGSPVSITHYDQGNGYGENTFVWKAGSWGDWPKPAVDTTYTVAIYNVLVNGNPRNFTYQVTIFDPGL